MKKLILLLLVITAISTGCKKYPDGPLISLRTAKHRLYGTYLLTQYTVNGVDSLNHYYDSLSLNFHFFYEDVYGHDQCDIIGNRKDGKWCDLSWDWNLVNHNKTLNITSSGYANGTGPFGTNKLPQWNILRLTNKETEMKTTYNGKEYSIKLEKQ
jgi:hypothetical protein